MISAVACRTRLGRPSRPGAFSGDVDLIASSISFSVISSRLICLVYCTSYVSRKSAAGSLRKKVHLNTSTFSLAFITSHLVYRH
jgi:membrane-anchored protein YejM (alkaline phosphatase superfamily)